MVRQSFLSDVTTYSVERMPVDKHADENQTAVLRELVREVIDLPPVNHCADDGDTCMFCAASWGYFPFPPTKHSPDCWLARAQTALEATGD